MLFYLGHLSAVIMLGHPWYIWTGLHHPDNCRFPGTKYVPNLLLLPDLPGANELTDYLSVQQRKLIDHVSDDFSTQRCSNAKRVLMGFIHHVVCWTHWCNFLKPPWHHDRLLVTCVPWVHFTNLSNSRWILGVFNSLAPGKSECDYKYVIFNLVLLIGIFRSSHDNALWWMPQDLTDDKSTLVQVMAWCRCHLMASLGHNELISSKYELHSTFVPFLAKDPW